MSEECILIYSRSEEDLDMEVKTCMSEASEGSSADLNADQTEHEGNVYEVPCFLY